LKRRTVTFTPEARNDLLHLGDWIAERAGVDVALNRR
jgi:plasmid stabilization system protein ParE